MNTFKIQVTSPSGSLVHFVQRAKEGHKAYTVLKKYLIDWCLNVQDAGIFEQPLMSLIVNDLQENLAGFTVTILPIGFSELDVLELEELGLI